METLSCTTENGLAVVTLDRPDKKNAMSLQMMAELTTLGGALQAQKDLRAVILCGRGQSFCSGIDLADLMGLVGRIDEMKQKITTADDAQANMFQNPTLVWRRLPVPVIAVLEGACLGAGMQLALAADYRIAAPDMSCSILEARWGIIPDMGISQTLPGLMRADQAMELVQTGRILSAQEALDLGLVTKIARDPMAQATAMAERLMHSAPETLAAGKALVQKIFGEDPAHLRLEAKLQADLLGRPNQMEKAMASFQKRDPKFQDRG